MVQAQNLPCSLRPWKAARSELQDKSQLKKQDTTTTTKAEAGSRSATRTHNCTMKMLKIAVKCIFIHKNNLAALESLSPRILTEVRIQNPSGMCKASRCQSNFSYFGVCTLSKESFGYLQCTNDPKLSRCQRGDCHHRGYRGWRSLKILIRLHKLYNGLKSSNQPMI